MNCQQVRIFCGGRDLTQHSPGDVQPNREKSQSLQTVRCPKFERRIFRIVYTVIATGLPGAFH